MKEIILIKNGELMLKGLNRANFEDALIKNAIPYRIVGGLKFYDRKEIKDLIANLKKTNPNVAKNIFSSIHRVNLTTIIGYTDGKTDTLFLDNY